MLGENVKFHVCDLMDNCILCVYYLRASEYDEAGLGCFFNWWIDFLTWNKLQFGFTLKVVIGGQWRRCLYEVQRNLHKK